MPRRHPSHAKELPRRWLMTDQRLGEGLWEALIPLRWRPWLGVCGRRGEGPDAGDRGRALGGDDSLLRRSLGEKRGRDDKAGCAQRADPDASHESPNAHFIPYRDSAPTMIRSRCATGGIAFPHKCCMRRTGGTQKDGQRLALAAFA